MGHVLVPGNAPERLALARVRSAHVLLVPLVFLVLAWFDNRLAAKAQFLAPQITYSVTVRSFMAVTCRASNQGSTDFDEYCPNDPVIRARVRDGSIGGHPDFERNNPPGMSVYTPRKGPMYYYNGTYARFGRQFPVTSPNGLDTVSLARPFVLSDLRFETTGIAKMQYCQGEEGYPCDFNQSARSVMSAESFSTWYSDSSFYNRRMGYKQPLYRMPNSTFRYEFDAANSAHNRLNNRLFDPISQFNLSSRAWPMSTFEESGGVCKTCPKGKFWFTTEMHTYFQYRGGEEFLFSGDDDIHVFINNRLAINLGGEHSALPISIKLDTFAQELNLTQGGIYPFDLFHAERQTSGSNFKITTTLAEACNVVALDLRSNGLDVTQGINWRSQPGSVRATPHSEWYLLGGQGFATIPVSQVAGLYATLMRPGVADVASYMFHKSAQNVASGFSLSFSFRVLGNGHGFAVVIHDRALGLSSFNGGSGPNLGIRNMENSFAIVFDMCASFPNCGADTQPQLRLHYPSSRDQSNSNTAITRRVFDANVIQDWRDGKPHSVQINYYATPDWLEVYVDDSLRLVERGFDVAKVIGGRNAFLGFTSSSSSFGNSMSVEIGEVALTTVKVNSRLSTVVNATLPIPLIADGKQSAGLRIQSRDGCSNEVRFGGLGAFAQGRAVMRVMRNTSISNGRRQLQMVETIVEQPARAVDNGDGTYSLLFTSSEVGTASLFVAFGPSCAWNGTRFVGNDSDCFQAAFPDAMVLLEPLTAPPTVPRGDPNEVPFPWIIVYGVGIGLGGIFLCCCFVALCLLRSRRKWRKEKKYVPTGQQAVLDRDLELRADPRGAKFNELTHRVQETSLEINKLRAVSEYNTVENIDLIKEENEKIKETMKGMKRRQMEKDLMQQTSSKRTLARDDLGPSQRRSFAPEPVGNGVLASPAEVLFSNDDAPSSSHVIMPVFVARKNPKATFLVSVSERDVDHMIHLANTHSEVLVGGELYGQMYENGDMIVMHSTGPGYGAIMDQESFAQSPSFVVEATDLMGKNSAFRVGSWISTSTRGKAVSEILRQALISARTSMPHAPRIIIMLVQLCGIKNGAMVVTITPYRYELSGPASGGDVGDLYVFKDDADALAKRRHEALEVLRSRPPPVPVPATASSSRPAPPQGPPPKRRFDDVSGPPVPPSRPLSQNLSSTTGPPPALPPSRAPAEPQQQVPTPRRFSITEEDENPLVPVILDGSAEASEGRSNQNNNGTAASRTSFRGFFSGQ